LVDYSFPANSFIATTTEEIIAHGIIGSLILTPSATWIAAGNWTIGVNSGVAPLVTANMTWYNDNGTASHTHEILNFRPSAPILVQPDNNSVFLRGVVDVSNLKKRIMQRRKIFYLSTVSDHHQIDGWISLMLYQPIFIQ
jgi:hypothetical protein